MKKYAIGMAIVLMLLSGTVALAQETEDYVLVAVPKIAGTWQGRWTSEWGTSGSLKSTITQNGTKLSGTLRATNTDCGTIFTTLSGSMNGDLANFKASWNCFGQAEVLRFTKGKITRNNTRMNGRYYVYVNGSLFDRGTFSLKK